MAHICSYLLCSEKEIPDGEAYVCSKCGRKPYHKQCAEEHIKKNHTGAAIEKLPEPEFPG